MKNILIVGGTSGLGLELAKLFLNKEGAEYSVFVTGTKEGITYNPPDELDGMTPWSLNLTFNVNEVQKSVDSLLGCLPDINLLVYAAGFYQEGTIGGLDSYDILKMMNSGLVAPALFLNNLLVRQKNLEGFIAITSTSQYTPRLFEPVYTAVKAGLGMLANSISLDPKVGKVLVAAPVGMNTNFWKDTDRDTCLMLDPKWVAQEIIRLYEDDVRVGGYKYKFAKILRDPPRSEMVDIRFKNPL